MIEALRLADRLIDLADGDPTKGNLILGSPLSTAIAMRGLTDCAWESRDGETTPPPQSRWPPPSTRQAMYRPSCGSTCRHPVRGAAGRCDRHGRDRRCAANRRAVQRRLHLEWPNSVEASPWSTTVHNGEAGLDLFTQARDAALTERFSLSALTIVDPEFAMEKARNGDLDGAIEMVRAVDCMFETRRHDLARKGHHGSGGIAA